MLFKELKESQSKDKVQQVQRTSKKQAGSAGGFASFNLGQSVVKAIRAKGYN